MLSSLRWLIQIDLSSDRFKPRETWFKRLIDYQMKESSAPYAILKRLAQCLCCLNQTQEISVKKCAALILSFATATASASDCPPQLAADAKEACEASTVADAHLNSAYQRILKELDKEGASQAKTSLVQAQRQWVKFRRADCDAVFDYNATGTVRFPETFRCEARHAKSRMEELIDRYRPQH